MWKQKWEIKQYDPKKILDAGDKHNSMKEQTSTNIKIWNRNNSEERKCSNMENCKKISTEKKKDKTGPRTEVSPLGSKQSRENSQ